MPNTVNLSFGVTRQNITRLDNEVVASGALNTLVANFDFCETWNGLYKFCRFEGSGGVKDVAINAQNKCVIPWEVVEAPSFTMACYGTISTDVQLTTKKLNVKVYQSLDLMADSPLPSTPELIEKYEGMYERAEEIGNDLLEKKANGEFNGRDGVISTVPNGAVGFSIDANGHLIATGSGGTVADLGVVVPYGGDVLYYGEALTNQIQLNVDVSKYNALEITIEGETEFEFTGTYTCLLPRIFTNEGAVLFGFTHQGKTSPGHVLQRCEVLFWPRDGGWFSLNGFRYTDTTISNSGEATGRGITKGVTKIVGRI